MTRITVQFDDFMRDVAALLEQPWYVWAVIAGGVAATIALSVTARARRRARDRIPRYKRQRSF